MKEIDKENLAIIMDGNRRWAKDRGLTTRDGHKAGAQALEDISKFCNKIGIKYLTVYAFSTENWKRSKKEVSALMAILRMRVDAFIKEKDKQNIRIKILSSGIEKIYQPEKVKNNEINIEDINEQLISNNLYTAGQPDPDLLIRTSKELRTSNFLPWQLVYTEFYFPDKHWPEFGEEDLLEAIRVYQKRNRRFGGRP